MATHDYVIDNSTGANVRTDLNLVFQAILTNNSSSSAPSTTAAYMWWADTSNGILKIRNSANNAWVELLQLDGTLTLEDGSASTPALANRSDLNTGVFFSAADKFNIATGGVERMELGTTTVFNEDGADVDFRVEGDSSTHLLFIDAGNDRVGIKSSSPQTALHVGGTIHTTTNLGIRVTSPASNLHVHQDDSDKSIAQFTNTTTGTAAGDGFQIGITSGEDALLNMKETKSILFKTADQSRMTLDSSGRLLLGTTTEGFATADNFTISDTSSDCGMTIRASTSNQSIIAFSDATSGTGEYAGQLSYYHSTDEMVIGANTKSIVKVHDEHINVFAAEGTTRVNLGFSDTLGAELSLYDDAGSQKTRITGSTDTHHFFNNGGNVAIGHNSPSYALDIRRDAPSGGRVVRFGTNGTHHTSAVASDSQGLIIFRARITVAANTTTDLVSGYGGNLVLITLQNNGGDDVQQTRIRTHAWSSTSSLFFNNYGQNAPTVTFSVSSGVLRVNHNHTGPIHFNVAGLLVSGPQSQ